MNAWQTLSKECEKAATRCQWCGGYGHTWGECPEHLKFLVRRHMQGITPKPPRRPEPKRPPNWGLIGTAILVVTVWLAIMLLPKLFR